MLRLKLIRLLASPENRRKRRIPDPWVTPPEAIKAWLKNNPRTYTVGEIQQHFGADYKVVAVYSKSAYLEKI